jgi:ornithine decarboxylase
MTITDSVTDLAVVAAHQVRRPDPRNLLGTPFLELETSVVAERLGALSRTFPDTAIHYAVNAIPHPDVLATVVAAGANFGVASRAEVRACLAAGADPDDLIYSNPVIRRDDISEAAGLGVRLFVVDTLPQVRKIAETAPRTAVVCRLLTSGGGSGWPLTRRYGCSVSQAVDILRLAADLGLDSAGISLSRRGTAARPERMASADHRGRNRFRHPWPQWQISMAVRRRRRVTRRT